MKITPYFSWFGKHLRSGGLPHLSKKIIRRLRAWIRNYRAQRKLKKSGYPNWVIYKHHRDSDINRYANHLEHFYKGYPYVYAIRDYNHYAYDTLYDYGPGGTVYGFNEMENWCNENIRWNYRCDIHRVWQDQWGKYSLNDIGGGDIIFFAFKREQDFTHFLLRWS